MMHTNNTFAANWRFHRLEWKKATHSNAQRENNKQRSRHAQMDSEKQQQNTPIRKKQTRRNIWTKITLDSGCWLEAVDSEPYHPLAVLRFWNSNTFTEILLFPLVPPSLCGLFLWCRLHNSRWWCAWWLTWRQVLVLNLLRIEYQVFSK